MIIYLLCILAVASAGDSGLYDESVYIKEFTPAQLSPRRPSSDDCEEW